MGTESRRKSPSVIERLDREPFRFDFFQAVRMLEIDAARSQEAEAPRRFSVGHDSSPQEEVVRFGALASHSFPPCEIAQYEQVSSEDGTTRRHMTVAFMGLTGPAGVLPQHYTQQMIDRLRQKDFAMRNFFDIFNHRMVSFFYRAWRKYRFFIQYERAQQTGHEDLFTQSLYCLVGLGTPRLRQRQEVLDETILYYASAFSHQPRNAYTLERVLADFFGVAVTVVQFVGQWLYLNTADQSSMPRRGQYTGANNRLGVDVVVGDRVWGMENKFRVRLGPLSYRQFQQFSPLGKLLLTLCQFIRMYVGPEFDFDVQPVLLAKDVPPCQLHDDAATSPRLGWNTWLISSVPACDVDDAIFSLEGVPSR